MPPNPYHKHLLHAMSNLGAILAKDLDPEDVYLSASLRRFTIVYMLLLKFANIALTSDSEERRPKATMFTLSQVGWLTDGEARRIIDTYLSIDVAYERQNALETYRHIQACYPILVTTLEKIT